MMPLLLTVWRWLTTTQIGRSVSIALCLLIALAYFYSWAETNGRRSCQAEVQAAREEQQRRVRAELDRIEREAQKRSKGLAAEERQLRVEVEDVTEQARRELDASAVCIPADLTQRLRDLS